MSEPARDLAPAPVVALHASAAEPRGDAWLFGGLSLAVFAGTWLFGARPNAPADLITLVLALAHVVNNPHFMASYHLLYVDRRKELLTTPRYLWAALVAPAAMTTYLAYAIAAGRGDLLGWAVSAMFVLVGWHYVKQTYGVAMVANGRRGYFLPPAEGRLLKAHLFCVWALFLLRFHSYDGTRNYYGITYSTFASPAWATTTAAVLWALTGAATLFVVLRKWTREGRWPSLGAVAAVLAIQAWYLPVLAHPSFWPLVPLFHSLQYLPFVAAVKRGEWLAGAATPDARTRGALKLGAFFAGTILLGAAFFHWIPDALDATVGYDRDALGSRVFMAAILTFINVHHYLIDNVIWRRGDARIKALMARR